MVDMEETVQMVRAAAQGHEAMRPTSNMFTSPLRCSERACTVCTKASHSLPPSPPQVRREGVHGLYKGLPLPPPPPLRCGERACMVCTKACSPTFSSLRLPRASAGMSLRRRNCCSGWTPDRDTGDVDGASMRTRLLRTVDLLSLSASGMA